MFSIIEETEITKIYPEIICLKKRFLPQRLDFYFSFRFSCFSLLIQIKTCVQPRVEGGILLDSFYTECLYDANLVGDVKCIVIASQTNISLFLAIRSDEAVNFSNLDVVEFANSSANMVLVCTEMNLEYQSVVVLNLLHGGFSCQWILDDVEGIHAVAGWNSLARIFWIAWQSQGSWSTEANCCTDLAETCSEWTLDSLKQIKKCV
jgi:hypothetical protein